MSTSKGHADLKMAFYGMISFYILYLEARKELCQCIIYNRYLLWTLAKYMIETNCRCFPPITKHHQSQVVYPLQTDWANNTHYLTVQRRQNAQCVLINALPLVRSDFFY